MTSAYANSAVKEQEDLGGSGNSLGKPAWFNLQTKNNPHKNPMTIGFSADDDSRIIPGGFKLNDDNPKKVSWENGELTCVILGYRLGKMAVNRRNEAKKWQRFGFFDNSKALMKAHPWIGKVSSSVQLLVLAYSPDLTAENFEDYLMVIGTSAASCFSACTNSLTHKIGSTRDGSKVLMYKPRSMAGREEYFWKGVGEGIIPTVLNFIDAESAAAKAAIKEETGRDVDINLGLGQHWVTIKAQDEPLEVGSDGDTSTVSLPTVDVSVVEGGADLFDMNYPDEVPALGHRYVGERLDNILDKFMRNHVDAWVAEWPKTGPIGGNQDDSPDGSDIVEDSQEDAIPF